MVVNAEKYREVLLYLLDQKVGANNKRLGKVKLMKLLYFADFDHFYQHHTSITGDTYIKLDYGPVPTRAQEILENLRDEEAIHITREPVFDYFKYKYEPTVPFGEPEHLIKREIATLKSVVARWKGLTTQDIVLASHGDPPWRMTKYGEQIPYHLVFYRRNAEPENDEEPEVSPAPRKAP